jgi:hypothetical protein
VENIVIANAAPHNKANRKQFNRTQPAEAFSIGIPLEPRRWHGPTAKLQMTKMIDPGRTTKLEKSDKGFFNLPEGSMGRIRAPVKLSG